MARVRRKGSKRVLISSARDVNLQPLDAALRDHGHEPLFADKLARPGIHWMTSIREAIEDCDVLVLVLSPQWPKEYAYFELGLALGLEKRVLLVEPPGAELLPLQAFQGIPSIRADFSQPDLVRSALELLKLQKIEPRQKPRPRASKGPRLSGDLADDYLDAVLKAKGQHFERALADAFRDAGVEVTESRGVPDVGWDFAIWLDETWAVLGNPILVEAKRTLTPQSRDGAVATTMTGLADHGARSALVIHAEGSANTDRLRFPDGRQVVFLDARDVIEALREGNLADRLLDPAGKSGRR